MKTAVSAYFCLHHGNLEKTNMIERKIPRKLDLIQSEKGKLGKDNSY